MKKFNLVNSIKKLTVAMLAAMMVVATPVTSTTALAAPIPKEATENNEMSTFTVTLGMTKSLPKPGTGEIVQGITNVNYKSKNSKVATVDKKTGKVTAKKAGSTVITLTYKGRTLTGVKKFSQKYRVNVVNSFTLKKGKSLTIGLKGAKWSTSNKKVATVSKNGTIKGKGSGKVTITAKKGSKTYKYSVRVQAKVWVVDKPAWTEIIEHEEVGHWETIKHEAEYERVWVPTETVWEIVEPEVVEWVDGHYEEVVVVPAVTEEFHARCGYCNKYFATSTDCIAHKQWFKDEAEKIYNSVDAKDWTDEVDAKYWGFQRHGISNYYTGRWTITRTPAVTETVWIEGQYVVTKEAVWGYVVHPGYVKETLIREAYEETVWVVDSAAWTETIEHPEEGHWEWK